VINISLIWFLARSICAVMLSAAMLASSSIAPLPHASVAVWIAGPRSSALSAMRITESMA